MVPVGMKLILTNLDNLRIDRMKEIILHCSATPNGRHTTAKDINGWHLDRGWSGIGYHYVIRVDNLLDVGRPEYWEGAHAKGHNHNSIGICMIGTDTYNKEQWSILDTLLRKLLLKYPNAKVIGHNEISDKNCPGFNVQEYMENTFNENRAKELK